MTYAKRVDANLREIADTFRKLGCSVWVVNDRVDLVIGYGGLSMLVEVKDGKKAPSRQKLTTAQVKFRETWTGGIYLVNSLDSAQQAVRTLRYWAQAVK